MPCHNIFRMVLVLALAVAFGADLAHANLPTKADRIVVNKSSRKLQLLYNQQVIRSYPISLGKHPVGPKLRQGDQRTPEGRYLIDWRNPQSRFHLALHISYPNRDDQRRAAHNGVNPGGNIMIHGLPNLYADGANIMLGLDWTDGCIAVSNQHMEEIWQLVADQTIIDILP